MGDAGDANLISGLGRSPGGEHGNPLQYSCMETPMDRGTWLATVHGVAKSRTWPSTHTHRAWVTNELSPERSILRPSSHILVEREIFLWEKKMTTFQSNVFLSGKEALSEETQIISNITIKYCWEYYYPDALENDIQTSTRCHLMFAFCKGSIFLFWFICNYESMTPSGSELAENKMQQCLSERRQKSLNENNDFNFQ